MISANLEVIWEMSADRSQKMSGAELFNVDYGDNLTVCAFMPHREA
jgi:hypothetical protein